MLKLYYWQFIKKQLGFRPRIKTFVYFFFTLIIEENRNWFSLFIVNWCLFKNSMDMDENNYTRLKSLRWPRNFRQLCIFQDGEGFSSDPIKNNLFTYLIGYRISTANILNSYKQYSAVVASWFSERQWHLMLFKKFWQCQSRSCLIYQ